MSDEKIYPCVLCQKLFDGMNCFGAGLIDRNVCKGCWDRWFALKREIEKSLLDSIVYMHKEEEL